jgi:hypothetical protein
MSECKGSMPDTTCEYYSKAEWMQQGGYGLKNREYLILKWWRVVIVNKECSDCRRYLNKSNTFKATKKLTV